MRLWSLLLVLLVSTSFIACRTKAHKSIDQTVFINKESSIAQGEKITVGNIEGYLEAVTLLKGSLINALGARYSALPDSSEYSINGTIFAKKAARKRLYVYYSMNLRVIDKNGDIVATVSIQDPVFQTDLDKFSRKVVNSIK